MQVKTTDDTTNVFMALVKLELLLIKKLQVCAQIKYTVNYF